jgi:lactate dehydrogenase-like 2-hydroxyacid dehydrogenase
MHTEWLSARANVIWYEGNEAAAIAQGNEVEGILWYGHGLVNEALLRHFPNIKVVSNFGAGYEHFDAAAILSRHLPMGHTPGCLSETVADFAWGLMISAARDIPGGIQRCAASDFTHINPNQLGKQVSGSTLGIVGMGSIGSCVAKRARGFNMPVVYHNRHQKSNQEEKDCNNATFCPTLIELLAQSDYVMLCCPVTPETENLMGTAQFKAMKNDAVLIKRPWSLHCRPMKLGWPHWMSRNRNLCPVIIHWLSPERILEGKSLSHRTKVPQLWRLVSKC